MAPLDISATISPLKDSLGPPTGFKVARDKQAKTGGVPGKRRALSQARVKSLDAEVRDRTNKLLKSQR
jgi:hypothetical protein